jgi:hypothetical protein
MKTTSDVAQVQVRPLRPKERKRFEHLMDKQHYLGWGQPVGETLNYVATVRDRWVGLLVFGAAAYALRDREAWIGWSREQRQARLNFITQNRRFLLLEPKPETNLASRILSLCAKRLAQDWQTAYGHPVWMVETFVDPQRFQGTCYRAAGWNPLGLTAGARRIRRDFYDEGGTPKQLFVKSLRQDARDRLCDTVWPAAWQKHEKRVGVRSPVQTEQSKSLIEAFLQVPEFRRARGQRHALAAVLACGACAVLAGAEGIGEMAEIVAGLEQR